MGEAVVDIRFEEGEQHVLLCGKDVTGELRKEEVGNMASVISAYPFVRSHLLQLQRFLADQNHVVMDGRDIASTVLPGADVKIFLTASPRERAKRRYKELIRRGEQPLLSRIEEDIKRRDERDMNRSFSPLVRTEDATVIDSSLMSIDEVVVAIERVFQCIK